MSPEVILARLGDKYPPFPYDDQDHPFHRAFSGLWSAWGRDPADPLAGWVAPGGTVVLKPNWVIDENPLGNDTDSLVTHPSVIAALAEAAARALGGRGTIIIGDAPLQKCDFPALMERCRMHDIVDILRMRHPGIQFLIEDWRLTVLDRRTLAQMSSPSDRTGSGCEVDPRAHDQYRIVDRGRDSFLEDISDRADRFRVTCYPPSLMRAHHRPGKHEYLVTRRVFDANLFVNLPKMKTHIKAGLTGALKNLVGVNGHKEFLPHHIQGSYAEGGDCYASGGHFRRLYDKHYDRVWEVYGDLSSFKRRVSLWMLRGLWIASRLTGSDGISAGSWMHNETIWRTTLDLNHIVHGSPGAACKVINIVDGIVAGEGEGPLCPQPRPTGILLAGENPVHVDAVIARLMGYDGTRIPSVHNGFHDRRSIFGGTFPADVPVRLLAEAGHIEDVTLRDVPTMDFAKPLHWRSASAVSSVGDSLTPAGDPSWNRPPDTPPRTGVKGET